MPQQYCMANYHFPNKKVSTVLIKIRDWKWELWFISHFYLSWVVQWALKVSNNIAGMKLLTGKPMTETSGSYWGLGS